VKRRIADIVTSVRSAALKNGASAFVDQGIISGFNFATFILLARWMDTSHFGVYVLAFSGLMFVQTIQHSLITRAHNILGVRLGKDEYESFSRSVLLMSIALALSVVVITLLLALTFSSIGLDGWLIPTIGVGVAALPWLVQDSFRRILYTSQRVRAAAANDFVSYGLQAGLVAFLFFTGGDSNILTVFTILAASSLAACAVGVFQLRTLFSGWTISLPAVRKDIATVWNYGKWLSTGEFVGWIGHNGHTWLIGGLLGAPLVAGYRAASYVTNILNPFDLAVTNYLPVEASRILHDEGRSAMLSWLGRQAIILALPYALIAAGISLSSLWLLDVFYDARYVTGLLALILSIKAWSRFLGFMVNFVRIGLMAAENNLPIFISQAISLVLFAVMSTALISWMGIIAAPIARIAIESVIGLYLMNSLMSEASTRAVPTHTAGG